MLSISTDLVSERRETGARLSCWSCWGKGMVWTERRKIFLEEILILWSKYKIGRERGLRKLSIGNSKLETSSSIWAENLSWRLVLRHTSQKRSFISFFVPTQETFAREHKEQYQSGTVKVSLSHNGVARTDRIYLSDEILEDFTTTTCYIGDKTLPVNLNFNSQDTFR